MSQRGSRFNSSSSPSIPTSFVTNSGTATPAGNIINILGQTVAAGTIPFESVGSGNTVTYQTQISQAITSTDATKVGLSAFNSGQFSVDSNGFVTLKAGANTITLTGDSGGPLVSSSFTFTSVGQNLSGGFSGSGTTLTFKIQDSSENIFLGQNAGLASYSGVANTTLGYSTLGSITSGSYNTAIGYTAGQLLTTGTHNQYLGDLAGRGITTGTYNIGIGTNCFYNGPVSGNYNISLGYSAGGNYTTSESSNINFGYNVTGTVGESNILRIGNGTGTSAGNINKAIICGINGKTSASGTAVLINSSDTLGTSLSSARYKTNIVNMGSQSSKILDLRPVTFNYKIADDVSEEDSKLTQWGLIAEEVLDIMPDLVYYSKDGEIQSVRYLHLIPMLLNELQKALKRISILEEK